MARERLKLVAKGREHLASSPLDRAYGYEVNWRNVSALFEIARGYKHPSFVYFIGHRDDGPVKIGYAKNPLKRLRTMQTGNPRQLRIEHVIVGDRGVEQLLHEMWEPLAIVALRNQRRPDSPPGTEWFRSEIREELFPVIESVADVQVELLKNGRSLTPEATESLLRGAHKEFERKPHSHEEVRRLAQGGGYIVTKTRGKNGRGDLHSRR